MDHRCLYGHRVPASFTFAIERRICPTCGAGTVTLEGYQLARRLAAEVPLQAVDAFNTVLFLQRSYTMTPVASDEVESVGEVLDVESGEQPVDEPEVLDTPTQSTVQVRPAGAREEIPDHPSLKPHEASELIAAGAADEGEDDLAAEELAFFSNM